MASILKKLLDFIVQNLKLLHLFKVVGVAISKNMIESLNGNSFPAIWLMNLILFIFHRYDFFVQPEIDSAIFYDDNQLIICTVIKVTPLKSETIVYQKNWGSPNLVQSKIRLLAIPLWQQFKIAINLAIWEHCKQHLIEKCHNFLTDTCISNHCCSNVMHRLYFLYNQTTYDSLLLWQNGFSLRHLGNVHKVAKSRQRNTIEWQLLAVCIHYCPWNAYT